MSKTALILGVGGQDGSFLTELLLDKGYSVHGLHRRSSVDNLWRIEHILDKQFQLKENDDRPALTLHRGDLADPLSVHLAIKCSQPDEIYNMADQDDVRWSHDVPAWNLDVTAGAVGRLLESVRQINPGIRVFQPVSSTMFGPATPPQNERTPLDPRSPYACAKACAWHLCRHHRLTHGLHVSCGIMFNHDSPRRGEGYLLHKICQGAVRIAADKQDKLVLGNLDLELDIGHAADYMKAAHGILQLSQSDDFAVGTGRGVRIRDLAAAALRSAGADERRIFPDTQFGPEPSLVADVTKLQTIMDWQPRSVEALIGELVQYTIDDPTFLDKPCI